MQRPKRAGGLALPNFLFYYWACNIQKLLHWFEDRPTVGKADWVQIEFSSCRHHLGSVVCAALPLLSNNLSTNIIVNHTIRIWAQCRRHFGLQGASTCSLIKFNHMFIPSCTDNTFTLWFDKGIRSIHHLYIEDTFASFSQLSQIYDLPRNNFFRYLQIRSFVRNTFDSFPNKPMKSHVDNLLELNPNSRGLISQIYELINNINPHSLENLRMAWDSNLGVVITNDQWDSILDLIYTSSPSAKHNLIQLKVVHRAHYTNARLAKMYPNSDPLCPRCKGQPADLLHMFWLCPKLSTFWISIFKAYSEMFAAQFDPDPICALFGLIPEDFRARLPNKANVARRLILLRWKQRAPPIVLPLGQRCHVFLDT